MLYKSILLLALFVGTIYCNIVLPYPYPLYKQCDSRWANNVIMNETICDVGCLMSSISMSIAGRELSINGQLSTPATLNAWLKSNNGYTDGDLLIENAIPNISPVIQWVGSYEHSDFTIQDIQDMLDQQIVVILNVNNGGHFVLAIGYDETNDTIYVNDPGFNKQSYTYEDAVGYRIFKIMS
ncbi:hypothetical protein CYY_004192 [Polysphondylium violaceum]|uniref:Peptidase C39-like domain-containing protein n=1 Tax=Polysphondylium violaceum TaxID=133409 RepID=A0A8J4PX59_9MYCE|nr:hypothetical protein CYY_004192 [Polysphondylium violaceum]